MDRVDPDRRNEAGLPGAPLREILVAGRGAEPDRGGQREGGDRARARPEPDPRALRREGMGEEQRSRREGRRPEEVDEDRVVPTDPAPAAQPDPEGEEDGQSAPGPGRGGKIAEQVHEPAREEGAGGDPEEIRALRRVHATPEDRRGHGRDQHGEERAAEDRVEELPVGIPGRAEVDPVAEEERYRVEIRGERPHRGPGDPAAPPSQWPRPGACRDRPGQRPREPVLDGAHPAVSGSSVIAPSPPRASSCVSSRWIRSRSSAARSNSSFSAASRISFRSAATCLRTSFGGR